GERIEEGGVYLAPDGLHLRIGADRRLRLGDDAAVGHFRPSADELFRSCAGNLGPSAIGLILTGMGTGGAGGTLALRRAGGWPLAEEGESWVVDGMPNAARKVGAVEASVLPTDLPGLLIEAATRA